MLSNVGRYFRWYSRKLTPGPFRDRLELRKAIREEPFLGNVVSLADRNRGSIDVGANRGVYTLAFKLHTKFVVAFEPIPSLAKELRSRFGPSVAVHDCALSAEESTKTLFIPRERGRTIDTRASLNDDANDGFELISIKTEVRSLDSFQFTDIGIIKIDVEGHELDVLRGAIWTISSCRPVLVVEIEERHHPGKSWEIINYVRDLDYDAFFSKGGRLLPIAQFDFDSMQKLKNLQTPFGNAEGEYINNFVFLPRATARPTSVPLEAAHPTK